MLSQGLGGIQLLEDWPPVSYRGTESPPSGGGPRGTGGLPTNRRCGKKEDDSNRWGNSSAEHDGRPSCENRIGIYCGTPSGRTEAVL